MTKSRHDRRAFLSAVTTGAAGGMLARHSFAAAPISDTTDSPRLAAKDYLFADGLTYLNTGTIGPCRQETIDASLNAWKDLESMPVKFYGGMGAEALAEKTRTVAARFLGSDLSEGVITNSTTSGMNAVAQGLRLASVVRVLITEQEDCGGP